MINLILGIIFSLVFLFYFCILTYYIFTTFHQSFSKTTLLWLDNWLWYVLIATILIMYFIIPFKTDEESLSDVGRIALIVVMMTSTTNLMINFPYTVIIYKQYRKLKGEASENFVSRPRLDIMNKIVHCSFQIIVWVINVLLILLFVKFYIIDKESSTTGIEAFQYFQLSLVVLSLVNIYCMIKLQLAAGEMNENTISNAEMIYQIRFHTTLFIYKTILDLVTNAPATIILILGHFDWMIQILFYVIILSHMIFASNLFFYYDQCNGIAVSKRIRSIFLSDLFKHSFASRPCRRYSASTVTRLTVSQSYNNEEGSQSDMYNDESNATNNLHKFIINLHDQKELKDFLAVNFLIIFKLLYQIFKANEKFFRTVEKQIADDRLSLKNTSVKEADKIESVLSNISRISKLTYENKSNFKTNLNFTLNEILNSLEDKKAKEQFCRSVAKDSDTTEIIFKIVYYHLEVFIELLPIFQIHIKDVLESLNPSRNLGTCKTLYEKKCGDASYSHFYTMDTFLNFEVYDYAKFMSPDKMNSFVLKYHKYITETIKQWKFTFLPPILGIFRISYLDYDKVIVLYRHPLAFSPFLFFKYWINLSLSDEEERVTISSNFSEVIDVKEIEIKDNIRLNGDDYEEYCLILKNDLKFLRSIQFELKVSLNIFIINELKNFVPIDRMYRESASFEDVSANDQNTLLSALQKTELFRDTVVRNIEKSKMLYGSDTMSSIEKVQVNYMVNTRYVIKVYMSDLFRSNHDYILNRDEVDSHNVAYCKHLKNQFYKIIRKSTNSSFLSDVN